MRRTSYILFSCLLAFVVSASAASARGALGNGKHLRRAIVKIYTVSNSPNQYLPWSMQGPISGTGSGAVIAGKRILTNAHVVSDQTFITVRKYGDAKRYPARVLFVSHDADLALLTVDEPDFFKGIRPLRLGKLPEIQQEVMVCGYPMGGDTLSTTKGVVSRVEHQPYVHSSRSLLAAQVDAAVNPGNSGGPVLSGGRIIGVVMQKLPDAQSIGYLVPAPVVAHFLTDVSDGRLDGLPSMGPVVLQKMENPAQKAMHKVPPERTGLVCTQVGEERWAADAFQVGDVLVGVEGHPVADDGTYSFREGERTNIAHLVQMKQMGQSVRLDVLRDGKPVKLTIKLTHDWRSDLLVQYDSYDRKPDYYIFGGLLFVPLTMDYLKAWGPKWGEKAPTTLMARTLFNQRALLGEEVIVLSRVLSAPVNQGYDEVMDWIISKVDGKPVRNLRALIQAVEAGQGPFVTFTADTGLEIVIDRAKAKASHQKLLKTYQIPKDRHVNGG